jgi:hypothetical protein
VAFCGVCNAQLCVVCVFRHSHFISSSSLLVQLPTIDTGLGAPTRGHFSAIVSLLTDLLSGTALPRDSRLVGIGLGLG